MARAEPRGVELAARDFVQRGLHRLLRQRREREQRGDELPYRERVVSLRNEFLHEADAQQLGVAEQARGEERLFGLGHTQARHEAR